ncbi:MAG TPA: hypothetical protein VMF91_00735 [Bryobacteraceae bacterium]|nr:hypothetical protein [Bryobacteraceae bacterium]
MHRITSDGGLTTDPTVSPDGTLLAYASDRDGKGRLNIWLQQLTGGSPIRLTTSDADDHQPSFSPDGTQVVFRSERDGGGIYVVPSLGGETRLIAKDGRDPSFSPDGKWIAYWVGNITYDSFNVGNVFVISSSGGVPQQLKTNLKLGYPIWSPDGKQLLALGTYNSDDFDWWVFGRDGHNSVRTGASKLLQDHGFPILDVEPRVMQWVGDDLLFSARLGDSLNIWTMHISQSSWQAGGTPRRLTSGDALEDHPHLLADGRIVFAGLERSTNLWSLAIDSNKGKPRGAMDRLTDKVSLEQFGSITADGRYLVFASTRSGKAHAWLKDLSTGQESRLSRADEEEEHPEISYDGTMIAYSNKAGDAVVRRDRPGVAESVCKNCAWVWDWSPDDRTFLYNDGLQPKWGIASFDWKSNKKSTVLSSAKWPLYQARFSPDGQWLAFGEAVNYSTSRLFITPLHNGMAGPESEWIPIADANGWCDKPRWSPDGTLIYFISHRDGYRCLWAQHVARDTKRPVGQPFSVAHFHSARLSMMNIGTGFLEIDVARQKVIFNLGELTGNIWLAANE